MKDRGVLHPELSWVLACMGHGDHLGVADAGLPIPESVRRIDLAFAPGKPGILDVLDAVLGELRVEAYTVATESDVSAGWFVQALSDRLPGVEAIRVSHEELKKAAGKARAIVRSGEFRPYCNVLLQSGVDFSTGT